MAAKKPAPVAKPGAPAAPQTSVSQAMAASMRKFMIISISVTVLIAAVGGYFIWVLANQNVKKSNEVYAQSIYKELAEKKVEALKSAETKLAELKQAQNGGVSNFELVTDRALPQTNDLSNILTMFQKLESTTLVKIDNISKLSVTGTANSTAPVAAAPAGSAKALTMPLGFKATGSYDQILKLLRALETSTRVFDFSTLKISGTAQDITLDMNYQVYYLPQPGIDDTKVPVASYKAEVKK